MNQFLVALVLLLMACFACNNDDKKKSSVDTKTRKGSYAYDAEFLRKHSSGVIELSNADSSSKILLSADYQGRVMTSTATGDTGLSFGWLN